MLDDRQVPAPQFEGFTKLPDRGVVAYVKDLLVDLGIHRDDIEEMHRQRPHWIAAGIIGTLDWVMVCGWWIWKYTGFYDSDVGYKYVVEFNGYEFDPDKLSIYLEDPERNQFETRFNNPGLEEMERGEALLFIKDIYKQWALEEGADPEGFTPTDELIEMIMWATFMWVLSEYGKDWIYSQNETLACVLEFGAAYLSWWDDPPTLLDPREVIVTDRTVHTCRYCGNTLWCVQGAFLFGRKWQTVCVHCLLEKRAEGVEVEENDDRIRHPPCPHLEGTEGSTKKCVATCPHSGMNPERVWDQLQKKGSERVQKYREAVALSGLSPRRLGGQTLRDIIEHFADPEGEEYAGEEE